MNIEIDLDSWREKTRASGKGHGVRPDDPQEGQLVACSGRRCLGMKLADINMNYL